MDQSEYDKLANTIIYGKNGLYSVTLQRLHCEPSPYLDLLYYMLKDALITNDEEYIHTNAFLYHCKLLNLHSFAVKNLFSKYFKHKRGDNV